MNTCSRIESLGQKNKIHMSEEVVRLLEASGKGHWAIPRDGLIHPKGKQALQTYWLRLSNASSGTGSSITNESAGGHVVTPDPDGFLPIPPPRNDVSNASLGDPMLDKLLWQSPPTKKNEALINWNTDVLCQLLANLVASRMADHSHIPESEFDVANQMTRPLDEVVATIHIPTPSFEVLESMNSLAVNKPTISESVRAEIRDFVHTIASSYPTHAFHNVRDVWRSFFGFNVSASYLY